MKDIRLLRADEIECRVQMVTDKGCSLLLYKDARVDMKMLDELYGVNGWQRTHELINGNLFCNIDVWDDEKKAWIRKQDVGVESNTEKEKGQASDAFKRAGFNIGIGRELYTAPFIWINLGPDDFNQSRKIKTRFTVYEIGYNDKREIIYLIILDDKGKVRYKLDNGRQEFIKTPPAESSPDDNDNLELALVEIKEANTLKALTAVYDNWDLKTNKEFIEALGKRKNEINNAQQK